MSEEIKAYIGVGAITGGPVLALPDEPRSDACEPWEPLYPASAITKLEEKIAGLEAKVDALMLEYCPLEMPAEQRTKWAKHQIANEATK